jgi:hypothetical protein
MDPGGRLLSPSATSILLIGYSQLVRYRLRGVQFSIPGQTLDRGDLIAQVHHGQRQTGIYSAAVDVDGACAALPMITALLRTGHSQVFTQSVQQGHATFHA